MPSATRIGDKTVGHCFFPVPLLNGSPTVFVNGRAVGVIGGKYPPHTCGDSTHQGSLAKGSSTAFASGRAIGRIGDKLSCGDTVAQGSPTVFVGG